MDTNSGIGEKMGIKEMVIQALKVNKYVDLEAIAPNIYKNIPLDDLVLFAMFELEKRNIGLSTPTLTKACFLLFSEKFCMEDSKFLPDSDRVTHSIWRLRTTKKLIIGRITFALSEKARRYEGALYAKMRVGVSKTIRSGKDRRMEGLIKETEKCAAYLKWKKGQFDQIDDSDICNALQGTWSTPKVFLVNNMESLVTIAIDLRKSDVIAFFDFVKDKFKHFLYT